MRIHILGIGGTFMSGLALLAKQRGHEVTGSDSNLYPPMSTQLEQQGIAVMNGYDASHLTPKPDLVIVGNVVRRGTPAIEKVLTDQIPLMSGPEWLYRDVLQSRWVLAVSGTHGKTTTTSMLAWILEATKCKPGFLIGGIPENFGVSACLGESPYFVIEADEYDSAFFDKRSKFLHYHPKTLIINNLEYDHADIFPDLAAIKQQFHHLVRTVPSNGLILHPTYNENIQSVLAMGCWTPIQTIGNDSAWSAQLLQNDGSAFTVIHEQQPIDEVHWDLLGQHNIHNALAAIAAAHHVGIPESEAIRALTKFKNVKRRLEIKGCVNDVVVYDDFAHHPTAIETTLAGLRARIGDQARLIAVLEFGSYTMRTGVHQSRLQEALSSANIVVCKSTELDWGLSALLQTFKQPTIFYDDVDKLVHELVPTLQAGDHVVVMSNSSFGGIHQKLLTAIGNK
jgi:UDP-N-acetylmuramate: L-alanyl-gamma-D-glutamyl-meso-diaminopimelate ligase